MTTSVLRSLLGGISPTKLFDYLLLVREAAFCGATVITISAISDRLYFDVWTFPPYQWLYFNITQSLAVFYGVNDWHYYLSQGLPLLLTTYIPFAGVALWSASSISPAGWPTLVANIRFDLTFMMLSMIATLSLISHKEVRFIYPLLPALHVLTAPHVLSFFNATPLAALEQPSQKAMLLMAHQKAETAVSLDNAQNFERAMQFYSEACTLLQKVVEQRSEGEDQQKLQAIVGDPLAHL